MFIFLLDRIRKLFKSLGKYEYRILDKIIFHKSKLKILDVKDEDFINIEKNLSNKKFYPKKMVIIICFHFNKKRIKNLIKVCDNIKNYKFSKEISIITNKINNKEHNFLRNNLKKKLKKFKIIQINKNPEPNLLPWFCFNILKSKYVNKSFSHFLFLEDDISINSKNINYWVLSRKILKKYNLIPAFLRCEFYKKKLFSVDNPEKIKIKSIPKFQSYSKKFGFLNLRYPYHAMCLMDRDLMKEYIQSNLISIDFGFHHKIMRLLYPIKELANIIIGYINVPQGFHNRYFLPYINRNKLPSYCIIRHLDNKYIRMKSWHYGKISIDNLLK